MIRKITALGLLLLFFGSRSHVYSQVAHPASVSSPAVVGGGNADPIYTPQLTTVLPPAPNAFQITKYSGLPVNLSTGSVSTTIPLGELKSGQVSVPISLSYNSGNGIPMNEVASRVGMSWALNAGGVITRALYGNADETATWLTPPSNITQQNDSVYNYLDNASSTSAIYDTQPDIFSFNFNGYSGKFYLNPTDKTKVVMITASNLKVVTNFTHTLGDWSLEIIDPKGTKYFFGGSGATETSKTSPAGVGNGCGKNFNLAIENAWYLKTVQRYTGEYVWLTYEPCTFDYLVDVTQNLIRLPAIQQSSCITTCTSVPDPGTCFSSLRSSGVILKSINTRFQRVNFKYSSRLDIVNDSLLSNVEFLSRDVADSTKLTSYNTYNLTYVNANNTTYNNANGNNSILSNRPFLAQVTRNAPGMQPQTHSMSYYNINGLASRLSFAQDYWGYFNGISNTTLIPQTTNPQVSPSFPNNNASRDPNGAYSYFGLLSKITYPTKGTDSLQYEPNTIFEPRKILPAPTNITFHVQGVNVTTQHDEHDTTFNFNIYKEQNIRLDMSCSYSGTGTNDHLHQHLIVSVINSSGVAVYTQQIAIDSAYSKVLDIAAGNYTLKLAGYGAAAYGTTYFTYQQDGPLVTANYQVGGVRLLRNISSPLTGKPLTKKYIYAALASQTASSGMIRWHSDPDTYYTTVSYEKDCPANDGTYGFCSYFEASSTPVASLFFFSGNHIYYTNVIELQDENWQHGGVEHQFHIASPGAIGLPVLNQNNIPGVPLTNTGFPGGLETLKQTFSVSGGTPGNYTPVIVNKVYTHYTSDARLTKFSDNYVVRRNWTPTTISTPHRPTEFHPFDASLYTIESQWIYPDTVITTNYDLAGANPVVTYQYDTYNNVNHLQLTERQTIGSDAINQKVDYNRPHEIVAAGTTVPYQSMINDNVIEPVIEQLYYKNNVLQQAIKTNYGDFGSHVFQPDSIQTKTTTGSYDTRVNMYSYNVSGGLLSQSKNAGSKTSYLWGYNNLFPVAEAKNAAANEIFHENFESAANSTDFSHSGKRSHYGAYTVSFTPPVGKTYVISWFQLNGTAWVYNSATYTGSKAFTGNIYIDDISIFPSDAQMSTYAYDPITGLTSSIDAKGESTFYEYDNFQRLMNVKDRDGNILKNYCYNYAGTVSGCPVPPSIATPASVGTNTFITSDLYDNEWKQLAPPGYTLATDNGSVITGSTTNAGRFAYFSTGGTITPLTPINGTLSFTAKGSGTIEIQLISTYNDSIQYRKTFNLTSGYQTFTWTLTNLYPQLEMIVGVIFNGANTTPNASAQFLKNFSINLNQYGLTGDYTRFRADSTSVIGNSEKGWYGWSDHEMAPKVKYLQHSAYGRMRFQTTARQVVIEYVRDFYDKRVINLFALTQTQNNSDWDASGNIIAGNNAVNNYTKITAGQTYTISGLLTTTPTIVWYNGATPMAAPANLTNVGTAAAPLYQVTAPAGATNMGLLVQRTPSDTYYAYSNCMVQLGAIGFKTALDGTVPTPFTAFTGYTPSLISGPAIFINGSLYKYYQVEGNDVAKVIQFVSDTLPAGNKTVEVMMPGQGTYLPTDPHIRRSGTYLRSVYFPGTNTNVFPSNTVNPGSVVYIHDSILSGFNISSDAQNNVWMMKTLRDPTYGFTGDVFSEGYAGRILYTDVSTPALTTQFANKLASFGVDKYWFQIGVNDYGFMTPLPAFYAQYKSLIEQLHALRPNAKMYIQSTGPEVFEGPNGETMADDGLNSTGPAANDYRDIQRALGTSYAYCEYVNFEGLFAATIANTADGIHPTDAGNVLYANGIKNNSTLLGTVLPVNTLAFYRSSTRSFVYNKPGIYTITATGGKAPYTFTKLSGTLPAGLTFNANGTITGTPTASGTASISVNVTDANAATATQSFSVPVNPAPTIVVAPVQLLDGVINTPYTFTNSTRRFRGYFGNGPYTLSISASTLPATMTFNAATGVLSGTPTVTGTYSFTITATDHYGFTGSTIYTWHVVSVTPTPLVDHFTPTAVLNGTSITVTGHLTDVYDTQLFTYIYAYVTQGGVEYGVAGSLVNVEAFKKDGTPVVFPGINLSHGAVTNIRLQNGGINPSSLDGITILYNANTNITP